MAAKAEKAKEKLKAKSRRKLNRENEMASAAKISMREWRNGGVSESGNGGVA